MGQGSLCCIALSASLVACCLLALRHARMPGSIETFASCRAPSINHLARSFVDRNSCQQPISILPLVVPHIRSPAAVGFDRRRAGRAMTDSAGGVLVSAALLLDTLAPLVAVTLSVSTTLMLSMLLLRVRPNVRPDAWIGACWTCWTPDLTMTMSPTKNKRRALVRPPSRGRTAARVLHGLPAAAQLPAGGLAAVELRALVGGGRQVHPLGAQRGADPDGRRHAPRRAPRGGRTGPWSMNH